MLLDCDKQHCPQYIAKTPRCDKKISGLNYFLYTVAAYTVARALSTIHGKKKKTRGVIKIYLDWILFLYIVRACTVAARVWAGQPWNQDSSLSKVNGYGRAVAQAVRR
jgi:hypothetical protein